MNAPEDKEAKKVLKRLEDNAMKFSKLARKLARSATLNEVLVAGLISLCAIAQGNGMSKSSFLATARDAWANTEKRMKRETTEGQTFH